MFTYPSDLPVTECADAIAAHRQRIVALEALRDRAQELLYDYGLTCTVDAVDDEIAIEQRYIAALDNIIASNTEHLAVAA